MPRPVLSRIFGRPVGFQHLYSQVYFGEFLRGTIMELNGVLYLVENAYYDGTNWRYLQTGAAAYLGLAPGLGVGGIRAYYAASGTADAVVTWTEVSPGFDLIAVKQATTATTGVQSTETFLTGFTSMALTATGVNRYLLTVNVQAQASTASGLITFRVRDGGASAPTTASTLLAEWTVPSYSTAATNLDYGMEFLTDALTAGTHTLGLSIVRGSGTGTASVGTAVSATHPTTFAVSLAA